MAQINDENSLNQSKIQLRGLGRESMLDVQMNKFFIPFSEVQRLSGDDDFNQNQLGNIQVSFQKDPRNGQA
ncbi:MAG TPA: hypothetical protein VF233_05130 [Nitrososphaeraceae archaeon]